MLTLPIREVLPATPRARIARVDLDGHAFDYAPGQAVSIANHGHEKRKPYSIAAAPEDARRDGWLELLVGVNADGLPGGHLALEAGQLVDVDGPLGSFVFPPAPVERRFVFIAGGTGIAPLRAMILDLEQKGQGHRKMTLFFGVRYCDDLMYHDEFLALAQKYPDTFTYYPSLSKPEGSDWPGHCGRVTSILPKLLTATEGMTAYLCGSKEMLKDVTEILVGLGMDKKQIKREQFW